jgi:predicted PhzF superfamily epimerase YddE/YHI9
VSWPLYQVDAFTAEPFAGNPAAVCLVEVELCGHATLASAHVLFSEGLVGAGEPVRFDSASGPLGARRDGDGAIWLDFPATPATPVDPPAGLLDALGAGPARWVGLGRLDYLVELETRRPCATWPPTSGAWNPSAAAG